MKRFKLLLVALATVSFGALTSCGGGETDDQATDTTEAVEVSEEPKIVEETVDTAATTITDSTEVTPADSTVEATEEEVKEETAE